MRLLAFVILLIVVTVVPSLLAIRKGRTPLGFGVEMIATAAGVGAGASPGVLMIVQSGVMPASIVFVLGGATAGALSALALVRIARGKQARPSTGSWSRTMLGYGSGVAIAAVALYLGRASIADPSRAFVLLALAALCIAGLTVATPSLVDR